MRFIGKKTQMLESIEQVINENISDATSLLDIFAGTGTVGEYFKKKYRIMSNDILYFSTVLQKAVIKSNEVPSFEKLDKHLEMSVYDYFSNIVEYTNNKYKNSDLFILNNYSPKGNRMYLTEDNALVIDLWRLELELWKEKQLVDDSEYYYLLACIIETIPYFSNISGTYGAYLKKWDPRALKPINLVRIEVLGNGYDNEVYNEDGEELVKKLTGDILYLDPPYNARQYLPNYHLLETIAKYDYPNIKGVTGIREYEIEKSRFCRVNEVAIAFEEIINNAKFKHIILSYNTDGLMSEDTIISIMEKYSVNNKCKVYRIPYKRFKSRKLVNKTELFELIFYIEKGGF